MDMLHETEREVLLIERLVKRKDKQFTILGSIDVRVFKPEERVTKM